MKPEVKPIKLKYSQVMNFDFTNVMHKIASKDTDNKKACHINRVVRSVQKGRDQAMADFQSKVADVYGQKDEAGKLVRPQAEPHGFIPVDGKEDEILKAQEELGETEFEVIAKPLTLSVLSDVKMSAKDIHALGPLFSEEEEVQGPGVPHLVQD